MPLSMAKVGEKAQVKRISGKDEVQRFLANLGFVEGADITVVSAMAGNLIVHIKDSRVAIDRAMANRIMI